MSDQAQDKKEREKWLNDIRKVISTPEGRRFYWGTMARCKSFTERYVAETNLCYFQKGQRSIGISLLDDLIEAEPEKYLQMQQERASKKGREVREEKRKFKKKVNNITAISSPSLPNTDDGKS